MVMPTTKDASRTPRLQEQSDGAGEEQDLQRGPEALRIADPVEHGQEGKERIRERRHVARRQHRDHEQLRRQEERHRQRRAREPQRVPRRVHRGGQCQVSSGCPLTV